MLENTTQGVDSLTTVSLNSATEPSRSVMSTIATSVVTASTSPESGMSTLLTTHTAADHHGEAFTSWISLSAEAKDQCIGVECCLYDYAGKKAWPAAGILESAWNTSISRMITDILNDGENQRRLRSRRVALGRRKQTTFLSPMLFLLSPSGDRAHAVPYTVFLVPKHGVRIAQRAIGILVEDTSIQMYGFQYAWQVETIEISANNDASSPQDESSHQAGSSLCGSTVLVCPSSKINSSSTRLTTVGGVLKMGTNAHYAMTCAHVFYDSRNDQGDSDEDTSESDGETEDAEGSVASSEKLSHQSGYEKPPMHSAFSPAQAVPLDADVLAEWWVNDPISTGRHIANAFARQPASVPDPDLLFNPKLDWALLEITDPRLWTNNSIQTMGSQIQPRLETTPRQPPAGELIILSKSLGQSRVWGLGTKSAMNLPWAQGFVEVWAVEGTSGKCKPSVRNQWC